MVIPGVKEPVAPVKTGRPATYPDGPTGTSATWVARMTLDDVPAPTRERARHLILDGIGCALVGAKLPDSRKGFEGITALDDSGSAEIIGWGSLTTSALSAAILNSSFIQGFEMDDFHPTAPLHSNSVVLPAMLGAASRIGRVSGADFLLGAILGYETGPRVGMALGGLDMLSRDWHSGAVFGPLAGAAAAGKLYGLDAAGFEDAFGIGATQAGGLMSAQFESMVKRMQHGFAARNGLIGAGLAATGYVGIKRVFERTYGGCLAVFGEGHQPDATQISANLGSFWETDRITVKAYSAMGLLHAAIDAALELRTEGVTPDDVVSIDIDMPQAAYRHGGWTAERPLTPIGAQMNVAYAVAVALLDGKVLIDQFTADRIAGADVWNLIDRTMTRHEAKYDELPVTQRLTTRVAATLKDGSVRDKTVVHPRGSGNRLLTNDEIVEKYRDLTRTVVSAERQSAIESAILGLEDMADISELVALLTPTVRAATD
ncbi:MmgE/PrpD family protein [Streptomyces olivochromogenes]|uniref:MmgE/PrpD family protein n=1 Tax=Streptomyces olivochromogenes TaxID=1963 RepID=A0A250VVW9_STROL|nr:MmgE/PrpD family protein [Streptomyces olivochromogenes]KUN36193.1 hypothetical protein AQJ27_46975 [Streptomyces olivochromogenes]GAX58219.1 MmgE/PrpD family protein [Streptomyces olivochromogenes]